MWGDDFIDVCQGIERAKHVVGDERRVARCEHERRA